MAVLRNVPARLVLTSVLLTGGRRTEDTKRVVLATRGVPPLPALASAGSLVRMPAGQGRRRPTLSWAAAT